MVLLSLLALAMSVRAADVITPTPELPKTSPWDLKRLSETPAFEWVESSSTLPGVRSLKYAGEMYRGKPTRVFAFYASPATLSGGASGDAKFPAVVCIHGGGGTAFPEWVELWAKRGYAAIAMDLAGMEPTNGKDAKGRPARAKMDDGGPGQDHTDKFGHMTEPVTEHWCYHAVANSIRAHSLIRSFKEVDANRTAVTGISWGGYTTCIVAGVDSRFKAAVPVYGCGFLWENSSWLGEFAKMTPADKDKWIDLYDPSKYLVACHTPIFFVNGTNDFHYRIQQWNKSAELVRGDRNLRMTVKMPHGHQAGWAPAEIGLFVDSYLNNGLPLPGIGPLRLADGELKAALRSVTRVEKGQLHWSNDDLSVENKDRTWQSRDVTVTATSIRTDLPPVDAKMWFFTVTDERGATVSSEVMFRD
jgi:dienelactone hydrolase